MKKLKNTFSKLDIKFKNDKLYYKGKAFLLSWFFKKRRRDGRPIPKSEEYIRKTFQKLGFYINRAGNITYKGKFYNINNIRDYLKEVPLDRRERRAHVHLFIEDSNMGVRIYYKNNFNRETSEIPRIMKEIRERVNQSVDGGYTEGSDVLIKFLYNNNGVYSSKTFNSFKIRDLDEFENTLRNYVENTTSEHENYTYNIEKITIKIIKENAGGCNTKRTDKTIIQGGVKFTNPRSDNNNCLFACLKNVIDIGTASGKKLGKLRNQIRDEFNIKHNEAIPISIALKIFNKYKKENQSLKITDIDSKEVFGSESETIHLVLENNHYMIVADEKPLNKCEHCLKTYKNKHTCNPSRRNYVNNKILKNGKRSLITKSKKEKENTKDNVIHYDIETYRNKKEGNEIHTTYIVGYTENDGEFKYMAGDNCISDFLNYLLSKEDKVFVNAFNGANFDHYEIRKEFLKRGIKPDKEIINNGSIIKFQYKNIELFDVCKHLQGSLSDNLKEFGCNVQKGDFDHDKASRWEDMSNEMREKCLKYLKSDVLGLKEIYDKLNNEIFSKYGYNLTSYISTSSLTFNLWKENINGKHYINLPTLEEEKSFRQAVRGGRTYKSKHSFKSNQYQNYIDGEINFDEIKDYVVDADVVSLYPTAMAHYEYPVGECKNFNGDYSVKKEEIECYYKNKKIYYGEKFTKETYKDYLQLELKRHIDKKNEFEEVYTKYYVNEFKNKDGERIYLYSWRGEWNEGNYDEDDINIFNKQKERIEEVINIKKKDIENARKIIDEYKPNDFERKTREVSINRGDKINEYGMKGKMGIYNIKYETNKNLQHSVGGRRDEKGALKWDLKDGEGWYSSIDIEDMINNGYKVEILDGYYWNETAYIFKDFINELFEKKKNSKKGSVSYALAKLFMNSLYGKMIQRPIYTKTEIISSNAEYWKFWSKNIITDIEKLGNTWIVSGTSKDEEIYEKCITKPTHLGAFILAYSRRIMLGYMKEANPHFDSEDEEKRIENDIYYTDTDSLQIHVKNAKLIKNLGNKELGGITDDLGDNCKIIRGLWIAPKLYMLEYVKKGSKDIHYHFRGKGLNKDSLNVEAFEKMNNGGSLTNVRDFQMKRIHVKRNSKQQDIDQFSIVHYSKEKDKSRLTKIVNSKKWEGRNFNGNDSKPWL